MATSLLVQPALFKAPPVYIEFSTAILTDARIAWALHGVISRIQ
jgi:hypothetical protein